MKINFSAILNNLEGKPLKASTGKSSTLQMVCQQALLEAPDPNVNETEKFKRWQLAKKINKGGVIEVKVEEVALMKKLVGKLFAPVVVGPAFELLEGKNGVKS